MTGTTKDAIKFLLDLLEQADEARWDIEPHKAKRNLDQNAFYWMIVGLIAKKLGISTAKTHNLILRRHPVFEMIEGEKVFMIIPDTDDTEKTVLESTTYHLMPTTQVRMGNDGVSIFRTWYVLKGSHDMTKEEFSAILDEALSEAKEIGVRIPAYERG